MKLLTYPKLLMKCNTLENKWETEKRSREKDKEIIMELQNKYISALEKVVNVDKLSKELNTKINEIEMKGRK